MRRLTVQSRFSKAVALLAFVSVVAATPSGRAIRIKDVAPVIENRGFQLIGYGLVVGLNGTGDGNGSPFTEQALISMLRQGGINLQNPNDIKLENVAGVYVTAELKTTHKVGMRVDVTVSSVGDAESLQGGTLLLTKLWMGDPNNPGSVYAIAQGPISTGGFSAGAGGTMVTENHPTVGKIVNGGTVEQEVNINLNNRDHVTLGLKNPDYVTAMRITEAINKRFGNANIAHPIDAGTVAVAIPTVYRQRITEFLSHVEVIPVHPDQPAKIIVNERTGTVVMGKDVRISTVAVAHGNISVVISTETNVAMPEPFTQAPPVVTQNTGVQVDVENRQLAVLPEGKTITELVTGLNALGVSSRDLITILQQIKYAGAIQADLEVQ